MIREGNGIFPIRQWGISQVTAGHGMGKIPFMSKDWKTNVLSALQAEGLNMKEASLKARKSETFVRDMLKRRTSPSIDAFIALASVLNRTVGQLIGDEEVERSRPVEIVGIAGAGPDGAVVFSNERGNLGEAPVPHDATEDTVAIEVRGDSMRGIAENGWLVYFDEQRTPPTEDLIGEICVVGLSDGRVLIKKLLRGRKKKHFDLESAAAPLIQDARVEWAARVTSILPRRRRGGAG
jgi:SOS-response transcriptional repressor LexA